MQYPIKNKLLYWPYRLKNTRYAYYEYYNVVKEVFFEEQYRFLIQDVKRGSVVMDFGAFIGDTAIYFARENKIARVYSYESDKKYFQMAQRNIALSPHRDKILLFNEEVTKDNINKILRQSQARILLKIDIEGAEAEVLKHANLRNVYKIAMEYHDCLDEVSNTLRSKSFKLRIYPARLYRPGNFGRMEAWR